MNLPDLICFCIDYSSPAKKLKYYKKQPVSIKRENSISFGELERGPVFCYLYKVEVGPEEGGDIFDPPFFVHGFITCQKVYEILKYPHEPLLMSKYECGPDKKYFGVLPREPSPFPPAHVFPIPSAVKREAFRELKESLGDAPDVTMFPLASTVLDDPLSTEFKSCWMYLNLLEASDDVIQKTFENLKTVTKVKNFYRGSLDKWEVDGLRAPKAGSVQVQCITLRQGEDKDQKALERLDAFVEIVMNKTRKMQVPRNEASA